MPAGIAQEMKFATTRHDQMQKPEPVYGSGFETRPLGTVLLLAGAALTRF
jgi:hypothetical protein